MKIAILGFGREGKALLRFIRKDDRYRGAEVTILDAKAVGDLPRGAMIRTGREYLSHLEDFDLVFRSPGVPWMLPQLIKARRKGVVFSSLTKIFFEIARERGARLIGVTGTKGKGTTSTLLYKILKAAGQPTYLAGNIGRPALEILPKLTKRTLAVIELSSFQLQDLHLSPQIAIVLEVFPDHQDAHRTLSEYYEAKSAIVKFQGGKDSAFYFATDDKSRQVARPGRGRKIGVDWRSWSLFKPGDLKVAGHHNFRNAVMAASVALYLGVPRKTIVRAAKAFRGLAHRAEFVRSVRGVRFFDDSASTNPQTAAAAIGSFPDGKNIVILGGYDKGLDYQPLAKAIKKFPPAMVILIGENKEKIAKAIAKTKPTMRKADTLKAAVVLAYKTGRKLGSANVLLSPGAASFDMFKNYADRGDQFKRLVRSL